MADNNPTSVIAEPERREVVFTRIFDAPRELVWKACTNPKFIPEWWGPKGYMTTVDKMDVQLGGVWRFVQRTTSSRAGGGGVSDGSSS